MTTLLKKYDLQQGIDFALKAISDKELLKWNAAATFLPLFAMLIPLGIGGAIFYFLMTSGQMLPGLMILGVSFIISVILGVWASLYALPRAMIAAMNVCGIKSAAPPSAVLWLKFTVRLAFINFFVWYDRKFTIFAIAFLLAILLVLFMPIAIALMGFFPGMGASPIFEFIPILAMLLIIFGGIPYAFGSIRHSTRTSFAAFMFLRGDGDEALMPKKSYDFVTGMTRSLFIAYLMLGGVQFIAGLGADIAGAIFGIIIPFGSVLFGLAFRFILNCFSLVILAHIFKHYWENTDHSDKKAPMFDAPTATSSASGQPEGPITNQAGVYGIDHMYVPRKEAPESYSPSEPGEQPPPAPSA